MEKRSGNIIGCVLAIIMFLASGLPIYMIDAVWWVDALLIAALVLFRPAAIILWVWGLVCAIIGEQGFWSVIYYICFAVVFLPLFVAILKGLFDQ